MMKKLLLAVIMAAGLNSVAFAQSSFTAKDASGTTQTFKSFTCNTSNICSLSVPADSTGAAFGVVGNPFFLTGTGSAGTAATGVLTVQGIASMTPLAGNITQIAGSASGVTTWGTAPTGASVLGVNANVVSSVGPSNTTATGSITSTQSVSLAPAAGESSVGIQVTGTWTGTLFVEVSVDGTNYSQTTIVPVLSGSVQTATITANGIFQANVGGIASFRVRGNSVASGTAVVTLIASGGTATIMADNPFPVTGYTGMTALNMIGNTAIGSATTDKPVMMGGSSTGASGGNAQIAKVDSSGTQYVNVTNTNANGPATMANGSPVTVGGSNSSAAINISTATTTQLVALSGTTKIYVMAWDVIAGGTGNITLEYGTGTNCGTGTTVLTGAYNLTAQAGISKGDGSAPVLVVPAGNALCALTSAAVQMSGSVTFQQF